MKNNILPQETSHLRLIGETTIIATKAGDGMKQNNTRPFDWIDPEFDLWEAQTVSKDTQEIKAYIYEQTQNGTWDEIFRSFSKELILLSFETHEQIKSFVENSPELLHPNEWFTHFLFFNKKSEPFIASVYRDSKSALCADVRDYFYDKVSSSVNKFRFVVLGRNN